MNLTMPTQWTVTWAEIAGALFFLIGMVWLASVAYGRIIGRFDRADGRFDMMEDRMTAMEKRNERADHETAVVKAEQHAQREKIAVMAEQVTGITRTLERIDRNVEAIREERK